jgi:hypothetical protein
MTVIEQLTALHDLSLGLPVSVIRGAVVVFKLNTTATISPLQP